MSADLWSSHLEKSADVFPWCPIAHHVRFGGPFFDTECFLFIDHVVKNVSFGEPLMVVEVFRDVISGIVIRNFEAHGRFGIRTSGGPNSRACFW